MTPTALEDLTNPNRRKHSYRTRRHRSGSYTLDGWKLDIWRYAREISLFGSDRQRREIWEVRVTEPDVQARLFGRFAEPDTLILASFIRGHTSGKRVPPPGTGR